MAMERKPLLLLLFLMLLQGLKGANLTDSTIVHLFEWKWSDVADECERFLAPHGYGAVQVSPASENLKLYLGDGTRPWWERYQVVSYILKTRSGDEQAFKEMCRRCNAVGVRVYVDVVMNHMTGGGPGSEGVGTAGSKVYFADNSYPAVPYTAEHFHPECAVNNYNNPTEVRNCWLVGLKDLNQTEPYVQNVLIEFLNNLLSLGAAGFRVDAAKHMWPEDLKLIYGRLNNLDTAYFPPNTRPYIYQEVIFYGGEAITPEEYTGLGAVTEFRHGSELSTAFRGNNPLKWLVNWGPQWGLMSSTAALVFIDNHDTQRGHAGEGNYPLTYKEDRAYKAAVAFMLSQPYGRPRVMSSFAFSSSDQGPPSDSQQNILSPIINKDNTCGNGWVCEHRWRQIYSMAEFRRVVFGTHVENWWDDGNNQIAFSRGNKGFIAFNIENKDLNVSLQTGLPPGEYCDVVSGRRAGVTCTGSRVTVQHDGRAIIQLNASNYDAFLALHVGPQSSLQA